MFIDHTSIGNTREASLYASHSTNL